MSFVIDKHNIYLNQRLDLRYAATYLSVTAYIISVCFIGYDNIVLSSIGKVSCYVLVLLYLAFNIMNAVVKMLNMKRAIVSTYFPLILLATWLFVRSVNTKGFLLSFQFLLIMAFALVFSSNQLDFNACKKAFSHCYAILLFQCFISFFLFSLFTNNNYFALIILIISTLYYITIKGAYKYIVIFITIVLLIFAGSRAVLLSFILSLATIKFFKTKSLKLRTKLLISCLFFAVFISSLSTIYELVTSAELSTFVFTYTGKRAETGRFDIWLSILSSMKPLDYLVGMGGGIDYSRIIGEKLSPHSGYMYMLSSYGLVGLILFLVSAFSFAKDNWNKNGIVSLTLIIALLFREFFETTLVHNNFPLAIFFWGILNNSLIDNVKTCLSNRQSPYHTSSH